MKIDEPPEKPKPRKNWIEMRVVANLNLVFLERTYMLDLVLPNNTVRQTNLVFISN